jgi:L-ascorbate metabolism protein UlaG (beta-lactamase superfamily)
MLMLLASVLVAAFAGLALVVVTGRRLSTPPYRGPSSDHFDGKRFRNQLPAPHGGFVDALRWIAHRDPGVWRRRTDASPGPPPPERVGAGKMRVTHVHHATTLIQMDGINVLTDPTWSMRASPFAWIGPRRGRPPGLRFEDLPPIDFILLSHNHYDHLDVPTLQQLAAGHDVRIVAPLGHCQYLARHGLTDVVELDWWQSLDLRDGVSVNAVPAQHFSARGTHDRDIALWAGYVLTGPAGVAYFAGDTAKGPQFQQVRERFGRPRLALLPIGAYRPEWIMSRVHLSPEEALDAHNTLGAGTSVAMHFGTFRIADDGQDEAPARLEAALAAASAPKPRFWLLGFGEGREVPAL